MGHGKLKTLSPRTFWSFPKLQPRYVASPQPTCRRKMAGWNLLKLKLVETYSNLKGFYKNEHLQQPRHHQAPKSAQISHSWHKKMPYCGKLPVPWRLDNNLHWGSHFFSTTWAALQCLQGKSIEVAGWSCCGFVHALVESCAALYCVICSRVCRPKKKIIDQLLWWQNEPIMPHLSFQCLI